MVLNKSARGVIKHQQKIHFTLMRLNSSIRELRETEAQSSLLWARVRKHVLVLWSTYFGMIWLPLR